MFIIYTLKHISPLSPSFTYIMNYIKQESSHNYGYKK